jgi:hypothetical protein
MNSGSEYGDKLDTIDLIITALKEHEKLLDSVYNKLEVLVDKFNVKEPTQKPAMVKTQKSVSEGLLFISCTKWQDFKTKCKGARVITYEMQDDAFFVYVKLKGEVFRYSEKVPRNTFKLVDEGKQYLVEKFFIEDVETLPFFNGTLKCGLKLPIKTSKMALTDREFQIAVDYDLDSTVVKEFLSKELSVAKENIVEGRITL